jgi:AcrR family transcriptional regulator
MDRLMSVPAPTDRKAENPVARHIARVAARLFAAQGYDATSVREIVEGAGVAKPTLYYYYRSKEGLAKALVTVPLSGLVEQLRQIVTTERDPVSCLEQILEAHFDFCREDPDRSRFLYALIFGPPGPEPAHDLEGCKEDLARWVETAIRRLAEAGIIGRDRVDACATIYRGLIVISTLDFLYSDKPLGQSLARTLVNDLLQGFDERRSPRGTE